MTPAAAAEVLWAFVDADRFGLVLLFWGPPERTTAAGVLDVLAASGVDRVPVLRARYGL